MVEKKKGFRAAWKRVFNGRRWNEVKTRKKMLVFSIVLIVTYTAISITMLCLDKVMDSTLTSEYFSFAKWLVVSGVAITLADKAGDTIQSFRKPTVDELECDEAVE